MVSARIEAMVGRALSWAADHLDVFQAADSPDARAQTALKPLVELSLLCMLCRRDARFDHDSRIRRMLAISAGTWKARHGCDRLVRNPEAFRLYAIWYQSLVHAGALSGDERHVVQSVVDHGYVTATEDVAFRDLDLRHVLDLGGYRHDLPSCRALYRQTVLGRGGAVLSFNHADAYSVTHTLFYLSDFGARPIEAIPRRELPRVRWIVEVLLGQYLLAEDWDLVAELLLGAACLRWNPPDVLRDAAWDGLLGAQREDGAIPSRSFEEEAWRALPESERRTYAFEHSYHTTLAAAIAGFTIGSVAEPMAMAMPMTVRAAGRGIVRGRHCDRVNTPVEAARCDAWQAVAGAAEEWLASLLHIDHLSVQHVLQILAGLSLTNRASAPGPGPALAAAARRAEDAIARDGFAGIDTSLLLLSAGILRKVGQPSADLEEFASQLTQRLPHPTESSVLHLLAALGHASWDDAPALPQAIDSDLFRRDEPVRLQLADAILTASAFGHRRPHGIDDALRLALPAWTLASLRQNQLERGVTLLRASNSVCPPGDPSIGAATAFLMLQQRPDGAFGFLGPERQRLSELRPDLRPELDVTLPVTVAALCCLAEVLTSDLRLYPTPDSQPRVVGHRFAASSSASRTPAFAS